MIKYTYYLDDIERNDKTGIHSATISTYEHLACVQVFGTDDDLTERVVKVLKGLNEHE